MPSKKSKPVRVADSEIVTLDQPNLYLGKWRTKLIDIVVRADNMDGYQVTTPNSYKCWNVKEIYSKV